MADDLTLRVSAIDGRHRGGVVESWQAYAEWLEQRVAALQHTVDRASYAEAALQESDYYRALPRTRQLPARRRAEQEQRRRRSK